MFDNILTSIVDTLKPVIFSKNYLPKWLLFISVVSVFNSLQCFSKIGISLTRKVYANTSLKNNNQINELSCRLFGTWTFISCVIRLYAALYPSNEQIYQICFISYIVALGHFGSELIVFKSCKLDKGIVGPFVVASTSLIWMYNQKEFYTGKPW
ncbi:related to Ergosterol biosynthetic protein 28 [Hanseniaspora guilliermondii]|uniref:Related to Ergosterol biosynthetic protein 28 n=1 Tax=Hanseniaspora guilliermondii TaxID=56406 RepID=A0A1L0FN41_9ASCO|nr:related to Ergosterol biosynthetic protein 28 [Hanseniaspora guilliermondii]